MDRIVLHIGTHKTGSSAIQGSLLESTDALLARGVLYPRSGRGRPGHNRLAHQLSESADATQTAVHRALMDELRESGASVTILATEFFSSAVHGSQLASWAQSLCTETSAGRCQVVAYVRPQWEWIESAYTQRVKNGTVWASFPDFLEQMLGSSSLDWSSRLDPWGEVFGELDARPYSRDLLFGHDVVADFWRVAGLGTPIERSDRFANRRPGVRATEMLRAIRRLLHEHRFDALLDLRRAMARAQRWIEDELPHDEPFSPLTPELVARTADRFSSSNERIVERYFKGRFSELFVAPEELRRKPTTWSLAEASEHEREVFAGALEQVLGEVGGGPPEAAGGTARQRPSGGSKSRDGRGPERRGPTAGPQAAVRPRPRRRGRVRRGASRFRRLVAIRTRLGLRG